MVNISSDAQSVLNKAGTGAQQYVVNQGGFGSNLTSGEATRLLSGFTAQPNQGQVAQANMQNIASQEYKFDPNKFLPGIQQQATSIFAPQQAQLEAIRQLQSSQFQDQSLQTTKDFDKQLQGEIESINNRGAYFSGGAVAREQEIGDSKTRALGQLGLQAQAADFGNLAQQAGLSAQQTQFIQDKLYNAESGAYNRWSDQRNFLYGAAKDSYQMYTEERNYLRDVFESDRSFDLQEKQFDFTQEQFDLTKDKFDWEQDTWGQEFALDLAQFNLSKSKAGSTAASKANLNKFNTSVQSKFNDMVDVGKDGFMNPNDYRNWLGSSYATAGGDMDQMDSINDMAVIYEKQFANPNDAYAGNSNKSSSTNKNWWEE